VASYDVTMNSDVDDDETSSGPSSILSQSIRSNSYATGGNQVSFLASAFYFRRITGLFLTEMCFFAHPGSKVSAQD